MQPISISEILKPEHVVFDPSVTTQAAVLHHLSHILVKDERIHDWNDFAEHLKTGYGCVCSETGVGVYLPHTRTEHVSQIVMAAARFRKGLLFEDLAVPIRYVFMFGIPDNQADNYLKVIQTVLSTFHIPGEEKRLRKAQTAEEFIEILARNHRMW